jgi:hypothetical protein
MLYDKFATLVVVNIKQLLIYLIFFSNLTKIVTEVVTINFQILFRMCR